MKILIVLSRDEYVRNYVETGAFAAIQREHECAFLLASHCKRVDVMGRVPGFMGSFEVSKLVDRAHYELFNLLTWRNRKKSRTFYYRFSRMYRTYRARTLRHALLNLKGAFDASKYVMLGNRVVGRVTIPLATAAIPINRELARLVRDARPDLVLLPCSAYDPIGNDLARLADREGFRTMFLVDNWDNLSSKSIFWAAPHFMGVWGAQSREHAAQIHDFDPKRVFLLGTPRFQGYYALRKDKATSQYPFPYVLFCGSALAFDELGALRRLDDEIDARPELYRDLRIVYRPHPWRQPRLCPDSFQESDFKHVVLDRQVRDAYYRRDVSFQPALDYYPTLLACAVLVVCPLTTMLIEAIICGTPVLAIAYDDGVHYTSPHNAYKFYLHFEGIERIVGLSLNRDASRLAAEFRERIERPVPATRAAMNASLEHFLYSDERPYSERLAHAIRQIAARNST